jgi:hypothetical protein
MFFVRDGSVHITAERLYLDEGLRTSSALSRQDTSKASDGRKKRNVLLLMEFHYAEQNIDMDQQFLKLLKTTHFGQAERSSSSERRSGERSESDLESQVSLYKTFREQLDTVSGLFKPDEESTGAFTQVNSVHEQYRSPKAVQSLADPWRLEFKKDHHTTPQEDEGVGEVTMSFRRRRQHSDATCANGCWHLTNSKLTGELEDSGEMQFEHRPPLGREKLNWNWEWLKPPAGAKAAMAAIASGMSSQICPSTSIPVSIVEFLDPVEQHGFFGEMEMLRLGGGRNPRAREATAQAQERCHLSKLTYKAWQCADRCVWWVVVVRVWWVCVCEWRGGCFWCVWRGC